MLLRSLPAVLAVLFGLIYSCTVLAKVSSFSQQMALSRISIYGNNKICGLTPGLTRKQIELCYQQPDATAYAFQGLKLAVKECQHQFQNHRWNCSSLAKRVNNPYSSAIFDRGFRESAFAHAISSAGVAVSLAKACSQGLIVNCGCDNHKYKMKGARSASTTTTTATTTYKWGGCSHNLKFGMRFSKKFLDSREEAEDIQSIINLHNNQVGRMTVAANMQIVCKCHGMSGSCELKTCWRAAPDFRVIGRALKERFRGAILVDQTNLGNGNSKKFKIIGQNRRKLRPRLTQTSQSKKKNKHDLSSELLYYQKSPNYCEKDPVLDVAGTTGRLCNRTSTGHDSCSSLCCGRGYNTIRQRLTEDCNCIFQWCCEVKCKKCNVEKWVSVCK